MPASVAAPEPNKVHLSNYWLVQVDRDWRTGRYGEGIRLYHRLDDNVSSYVIVRDQKVNADGSVTVNATNGTSYLLAHEPNIGSWAQSEYAAWKSWDVKNGVNMEEDRPDYEPWAYKTRAAFAGGQCSCSEGFYREA
jgi:hypothetical protein